MRMLVRWLVRGLALVALLVVVAALAGWLYLRSDRGEAFLRAQIDAAVRGMGGRVTVGDLEVVSPSRLRADDLTLTFGGRTALRVDHVSVTWRPFALLWGEIRLGSLALERPIVRLVRRDDDWGLPDGDDDGGAPGPRIRVSRLRVEDGRLALSLDGDEAPTRLVLRDLRGTAGLTIGWLGTRVDLRELHVRPARPRLPALALRGGVQARGGGLRIDAQAATERSTVALALTFGTGDALAIELRAPRLAAADLRRLVSAWEAEDDLALTLTAEGPRDALDTTIAADLGERVALRASGTVDAEPWPPRAALDLDGSRVEIDRLGPVRAEDLAVRLDVEAMRADVEGALLVRDGRVEVDGRVARGPGGARVETAFSTTDLEPLVGIAGSVRGTAALRGDELSVQIAEARTPRVVVTRGVVSARLNEGAARVTASGHVADAPDRRATLQADVMGLGGEWRADASIDVADPALGTLAAAGRLQPIAAGGVQARLETVRLSPQGRVPWRLAQPAVLRWADGLATDGLVLVRDAGRLRVSGRLRPGAGDRALDLEVAARAVDLADFAAYLPAGIESVTGRLDATARLRGALDAPVVDADGTVVADRARVAGLGTLREVRLEVRARSGDMLTVESLEARAGDGRITGSGAIGFGAPDEAPLRAELRLRRMTLRRRPLYEGVVGGRVVVDGTVAAPRLTADLRVPRATVRPRLLPEEGAHLGDDPTITVVGEPTAEPEPSVAERISPLEVRATVTLGDDVRIERKDANIRLAGTLVIEKDPGGPIRLRGPIELAEGWYVFKGRRFDIRQGAITFTGRPDPDPELRIRARYRTPGYVVWVEVGGTASAPSLTLSSEPALSEADVLSVLLFGRPAHELQGEQQDVVEREARSVAFSYVAPALEASARKVLPLDRIEVSGDEVSVARYVTQDIFISLSQELTDRGGQTVGMEYDLTPRTSLKLSTSSRGSSAIDFFWRRRY